MFLAATTDKFQLLTAAAGAIHVSGSYADAAATAPTSVNIGKTASARITTATTTDIVAAPGSSTVRTLLEMTIYNASALVGQTVKLILSENGTLTEKIAAFLLPGESLCYGRDSGWRINRPQLSEVALLTAAEAGNGQLYMFPAAPLQLGAAITCASGTAYFVYMGRTTKRMVPQLLKMHLTTAGAGTETGECGLFSTPQAPNDSAQTMTKIVATGTFDSTLNSGAPKIVQNAAAFTVEVPPGTHLWGAVRFAFSTTQPSFPGLYYDWGQQCVLTATPGALTSANTVSGTALTVTTSAIAPGMMVQI